MSERLTLQAIEQRIRAKSRTEYGHFIRAAYAECADLIANWIADGAGRAGGGTIDAIARAIEIIEKYASEIAAGETIGDEWPPDAAEAKAEHAELVRTVQELRAALAQTQTAAPGAAERVVRWEDLMRTGVGALCHPGDRQTRIWLLMFDDADRRGDTAITADEAEAKRLFANAEARGWNCHLFVSADRAPHGEPARIPRELVRAAQEYREAHRKRRGKRVWHLEQAVLKAARAAEPSA